MKPCPVCGGNIHAVAIRCKHCGAVFSKHEGGARWIAFGCLVSLVAVCVGVVAMVWFSSFQQSVTPQAAAAPLPRQLGYEVNNFTAAIRGVEKDAGIQIVRSVSAEAVGERSVHARVVVTEVWRYQPYQRRLQLAQSLQLAWAGVASPDAPDSAPIRILDGMGNEVGGSRFLGGTLLWVKE
jgi:hypothetical protein